MYSILLIDKTKIDVTKKELHQVLNAVSRQEKLIVIGKYAFAGHQFARSMPKAEADFEEKMRLREKGFYRCRSYGLIHKLGERCECKETGEIDPRLKEADNTKLGNGRNKPLTLN